MLGRALDHCLKRSDRIDALEEPLSDFGGTIACGFLITAERCSPSEREPEPAGLTSQSSGRRDGNDVRPPRRAVPIVAGDQDKPAGPGLGEDFLGIPGDFLLR